MIIPCVATLGLAEAAGAEQGRIGNRKTCQAAACICCAQGMIMGSPVR